MTFTNQVTRNIPGRRQPREHVDPSTFRASVSAVMFFVAAGSAYPDGLADAENLQVFVADGLGDVRGAEGSRPRYEFRTYPTAAATGPGGCVNICADVEGRYRHTYRNAGDAMAVFKDSDESLVRNRQGKWCRRSNLDRPVALKDIDWRFYDAAQVKSDLTSLQHGEPTVLGMELGQLKDLTAKIEKGRVIVANTPAAEFVAVATLSLRGGAQIQTKLRFPTFYVQLVGEKSVPLDWIETMAVRFAKGDEVVRSRMGTFAEALSADELEKLADCGSMVKVREVLGEDRCRALFKGLIEEFASVTEYGVILPLATMTSIPPRAKVYVDATDEVVNKVQVVTRNCLIGYHDRVGWELDSSRFRRTPGTDGRLVPPPHPTIPAPMPVAHAVSSIPVPVRPPDPAALRVAA